MKFKPKNKYINKIIIKAMIKLVFPICYFGNPSAGNHKPEPPLRSRMPRLKIRDLHDHALQRLFLTQT